MATQRSGTTAIGRLMGRQRDIRYAGEIFHNVRGPQDDHDFEKFMTLPEANFFSFKERLLVRSPALVYPSVQNQACIWSSYRDHLHSLAPEATWIIDVKYNSLHNLNPIWHDIFSQPLLIEILQGEHVPILHLVRNDIFAQAISAIRANQLEIWHQPSSQAADDQRSDEGALTFDPIVVEQMMTRNMHLQQHYGRLLSTYPNIRTLAYEDAFVDGRVSEAARSVLSELFAGNAPVEGETDLSKREGSGLASRIANKEAIVAHFERTPNAELVKRHLQSKGGR